MRSIYLLAIAVAGTGGFVGAAFAADMSGADIKGLISGKTVYQELTAASITGKSGPGVIYYEAGGTVLYKTPAGAIWHGKWEIKGDTLCNDWKERPNNPCTRWDKTGDTITTIRSTTGETISKIQKIVPGNAENLAP